MKAHSFRPLIYPGPHVGYKSRQVVEAFRGHLDLPHKWGGHFSYTSMSLIIGTYARQRHSRKPIGQPILNLRRYLEVFNRMLDSRASRRTKRKIGNERIWTIELRCYTRSCVRPDARSRNSSDSQAVVNPPLCTVFLHDASMVRHWLGQKYSIAMTTSWALRAKFLSDWKMLTFQITRSVAWEEVQSSTRGVMSPWSSNHERAKNKGRSVYMQPVVFPRGTPIGVDAKKNTNFLRPLTSCGTWWNLVGWELAMDRKICRQLYACQRRE